MPDVIMKTVWEAKDSISAECHYNPSELAKMLKASKLSYGERTIDLHKPNKANALDAHSSRP